MTMTTLPMTSDATFADDTRVGVVAVEFSAEWCGPCRVFAPIVEAVAREYAGRLRVLQMDADVNPVTMARLGVRGMPTVVVFREGGEIARVVGAVPKARLVERLDAVLAGA